MWDDMDMMIWHEILKAYLMHKKHKNPKKKLMGNGRRNLRGKHKKCKYKKWCDTTLQKEKKKGKKKKTSIDGHWKSLLHGSLWVATQEDLLWKRHAKNQKSRKARPLLVGLNSYVPSIHSPILQTLAHSKYPTKIL